MAVAVRLRVRARGDPVEAGCLGALLAAFVGLPRVRRLRLDVGADRGQHVRPRRREHRARLRGQLCAPDALDWRVRGVLGAPRAACGPGPASGPGLDGQDPVQPAGGSRGPLPGRDGRCRGRRCLRALGRVAVRAAGACCSSARTASADAAADIRRAWQLEPTNYRHPLLLARIEALQGKVRRALEAFRDARRLAPKKQIVEGGPASIGPNSGP